MRRRKQHHCGNVEVKSGLEAKIGNWLTKRGVDWCYEKSSFPWEERLPRAYCKECDTKICYVARSYTPDFFLNNGVIFEVKGRFTSKDRKIAAAMKEQHPALDIRMVFDKNDWLNKAHKNRYGDWCDSKGILWCAGFPPEDWIR